MKTANLSDLIDYWRRGETLFKEYEVPKFELGKVVATPGVLDWATRNEIELGAYLEKHAAGDWRGMPPNDIKANEQALRTGEDRIFSSYESENGDKVWIITERDRSATTILRPDEY